MVCELIFEANDYFSKEKFSRQEIKVFPFLLTVSQYSDKDEFPHLVDVMLK